MFEPRIAAAICCGLVCHEYYCKRERVGIRGLKSEMLLSIPTYSKLVADILVITDWQQNSSLNKSIY